VFAALTDLLAERVKEQKRKELLRKAKERSQRS
jgi:hypothetical protein